MRKTSWMLCPLLVACSSHVDAPESECSFVPALISFSADPAQPAHSGHSAFDGNAHDYRLVAYVPSAADTASDTNTDPLRPSSLQWTVDDAYLKKQDIADMKASVLLTTKRAGMTAINVSGETLSGMRMQQTAGITISQADADEWKLGDSRYTQGLTLDVDTDPTISDPTCDPPASLRDFLSKNTACAYCHDDRSGITAEETPAQTAGISDDELIAVFTEGKKPAGYVFTSNILKYAPEPDCTYAAFHTWPMNEATKKGLVWKLRSLATQAATR